MNSFNNQKFIGERALFGQSDLYIKDSVFCDGESPLKESKNLELDGCLFQWKYPFWYCENVKVVDCTWEEMGRAGVWYTKNMTVSDSLLHAPKNFRRCDGLTLKNVTFTNAAETLWNCNNVNLKDVTAKGDYFAMGTENIEIDHLDLDGNYPFDGGKNVVVKNSKLISKDAFWNCENVTVYDSYISGEYLGWNSKNLTFINCTIESLQGMCYIDNLVMKNCKLENTTLAFEYCIVDAEIEGKVDSVFNPSEGTIKADTINELIIERDIVDPSKTKIICSNILKTSDLPEWKV